jgi:outer membrane protein
MRTSRLNCSVAGLLALLMAVGPLVLPAAAQYTGDQYSKPKSAFPNFTNQYSGRDVPQPNFANSGRVDQLIRGGKMYLSLNDAITLALENNLDLVIARYNLSIADTDILRAKAGGSPQGVNTGVVSGTPGGTGVSLSTAASGGGAGGTSTGSGGAATGAGGIVTSTTGAGPQTDSFDPSLTGSLGIEHASAPLSNSITSGLFTSQQNTGTGNFGFSQGFPTGALFTVGFNNSRITTNSVRNVFVPQLSSQLRASFRQHLLQGFGYNLNTRLIRIAKNNREISDVAFRQQVISTVAQIENLYWDLVSAYENVRVQERAMALAQKTEQDNRKQVEIGTLAPIEIVRAQATVAADQQNLIIAQTALQYQQLLMKNAVTRNGNDPMLASAEVVPTDTMTLPGGEEVQPVQDLINTALQHRPELVQGRIDLTNRDISKKGARNALLPALDLVGFYGTSSLAGQLNPNLQNFAGSTTQLPPNINSGYGTALGDLFGGNYPDYQVGFNLTIPIRNRQAQATQVRAELEYRQAQARLQQLQNSIALDVRNQLYTLQQSRARVAAAQQQRELAAQSLDAENKKYALGASTNTLVLQAQSELANAEGNVVTALSAYEKSRVALDISTSTLLEKIGINVVDAETGNVTHMPMVPGVQPRTDTNNPTTPQTVPPQNQVTPAPPGVSPSPAPNMNPAPTTQPPAKPPVGGQAPPELR